MWWWPERLETTYHIDPRGGGSYRFVTADVEPFGVLDLAGTFLEVTEPSRLRYTWRWASDLGHESTVTVEFEDVPEGMTNIRIHHVGLADEQDVANHVQGWNDCLDRLEVLPQAST